MPVYELHQIGAFNQFFKLWFPLTGPSIRMRTHVPKHFVHVFTRFIATDRLFVPLSFNNLSLLKFIKRL